MSSGRRSSLVCAILKHDQDKIDEILNQHPPKQDYIIIKYADDCNGCVQDLELCLEPQALSYGSLESVIEQFGQMVTKGQCLCYDRDSGTVDQEDSERNHGVGITQGVTLLHLACMYGPTQLIRRLLDAGLDANAACLETKATPLHSLAHSYMAAVMINSAAELLLEAGASVCEQDMHRKTPIHLAIENQHIGLAKSLLRAISGMPCDMENEYGETPLLQATQTSNIEILKILVESGANPNIQDKEGMLAINVAIHKDNDIMIRLITSSPIFNPKLIGMARQGFRPLSPLIYATCRENAEAVRLLLNAGAFVDSLDNDDSQPLLVAAHADNIDIAKILVDHGADVNLAPRQGYMPLHHAAWEGHTDMCQLLLEAGSLFDTQTQDKNTPLALACHGDCIDTMRLLLARGCNLNNQDKDLDTPLHYCTYNANQEAVRLLLDAGAHPDLENSYRVTPLWNAAYTGSMKVSEMLIQCNVRLSVPSRGIDQDAQTDEPTVIFNKPRTPLFVAASGDRFALVALLVSAGTAMHEEHWFWEADFPQALRENGRMLHWLTQQVTQPPSLLRLSRMLIRSVLPTNPDELVERLEIPTVLKDFLLIKDFNHDL